MNHQLEEQSERYKKQYRQKKIWKRILGVLGCMVVFCTTYALILPAITMEKATFCKIQEHQHDETCYSREDSQGNSVLQTELICSLEHLGIHVHTENCYSQDGTLICGYADFAVHEHGESCYDEEGNLLCSLPEIKTHVHTESCYTETTALTCTIPESEEHQHDETCSEATQTLTCQLEETDGHAHTDDCYAWERVLVCDLSESLSEDTSDSSVDGSEEMEQQAELICEKQEVILHEHGESCFDENGAWICGMLQVAEHTHDENCFRTVETSDEDESEDSSNQSETSADGDTLSSQTKTICGLPEHTHGLACYSDPSADVETAADWEKTFADAELTGDWALDVLSIAKTQLGYAESTKNYTVLEDGETMQGYSRYGAWYGDPYGNWCAMFVSFCLDYAGVEGMPLDANCENWIEALSQEEYGLYFAAEDYEPVPGDVVFFDLDGDGKSDHVGLLEELTEETKETKAQIRTIEGNSADQVREASYDADSTRILGYGSLGKAWEKYQEKMEAVNRVIAMIEALPSADEIDAKLAEFEEAEDYEGEEFWYTAVCQKVAEAYQYYMELTDDEKALVTNADKLMELEYIWSAVVLIDEITSDAPTVTASVRTSEFIQLNLYDYGSNINTLYKSNNKYPGFQWNGGAYLKSTYDRHVIDYIDFGNSMITDLTYESSSSGSLGKSDNAVFVGNQGGAINALDVSTYGITNRPIGMSLADSITDTSSDVLKRTLGSDGYPALTDGTSLSYLFSDGTYADKQNTVSIDGLFQQDAVSGAYYYNSRENHAQYSNNRFTLYNQIITPNYITYPFGNFLPFNDITDGSKATQVSKITSTGTYVQHVINDLYYASDYSSNTTKQQLVEMLAKYREDLRSISTGSDTAWNTWTAKDAIEDYFIGEGDSDSDNPSDDTGLITNALLKKMYNIDWDVKTNFFFGMDMTMNFIQPKGGMTGNDTNQDGASDYPMVFYFTGDDDVWVYIDDVLFLDLSGIHRHVGGEIDFVNGLVKYYYLDTANTGDVSTSPYQTYTFAEILKAAGKSTSGLNSQGTFADYTTHQFKFYYMERGSGSSVCRLNFNFPLLRQNSISVSKEVDTSVEVKGDPDYPFQVLKANSDGSKTETLFIAAGTEYTLYDENDNVLGTGTTDQNGVFTLKAGQRAEFTGIQENAGKYYVRELLADTVLEQYGKVTVSGESTTISGNVNIGSDTFTGVDSPVKDMSDGATFFRFTNVVDEDKLGELSIRKELTEYGKARETKYYDIQVTLDGQPLPVGTTYTVGGETRTVISAGLLTIAADETAVLSNILAGTEFTVEETKDSATGYIVTYTTEDGYTIEQTEQGVKGIIKVSADVQLVVTNGEKGATVIIPGTKSMAKYDGEERTYTFCLNEVTDATGAVQKEGGIQDYTTTAVIGDQEAQFQFEISYVQAEQEHLPAVFYYRIQEETQPDTLVNDTVYVVEVTVDQAEDEITAQVTRWWKDGTEITGEEATGADFVNTLYGDLTIQKTVVGGTEAMDQEFGFTIWLADVEDAAYTALRTGSDEPETILFENGMAEVSLKHGETFTIQGIPYGTAWTVTETESHGYIASASVTAKEETVVEEGSTVNGSIIVGETLVAYMNSAPYELPEAGGSGVIFHMTAGLLLLVCGIFYLLYSKK